MTRKERWPPQKKKGGPRCWAVSRDSSTASLCAPEKAMPHNPTVLLQSWSGTGCIH